MDPKRQGGAPSSTPRAKKPKKEKGYDDILSNDETSTSSNNSWNQLMIKDEEEDLQEGYEEVDGEYLEDIFIPAKYTRVDHPQTGERLVIEKIECEYFKCYEGLNEVRFHKNFSAIVGKNGSGKSSLIDAILFVFGYRAAKFGCKKLSQLIHRHSDYCEVTVHFVKIIDNGQNDDDFEVVPDSKITVTRIVKSDNSSAYKLNEKKATLQQVASFLKTNGLEIVHNRFLLRPKEINLIAQMPSKTPNGKKTGLLEFLEEFIGTKRYIKCLAALEQRVEQLEREDINRSNKFREAYDATTAQRRKEFMEGFAVISSKFKEIYKMISVVGNVELDFVDPTDPFSSGIQFSSSVEGRSFEEKALLSLALIFALHYFKPSPLYLMDDIVDQLDVHGEYTMTHHIRNRVKFTQFIITTKKSYIAGLANSCIEIEENKKMKCLSLMLKMR